MIVLVLVCIKMKATHWQKNTLHNYVDKKKLTGWAPPKTGFDLVTKVLPRASGATGLIALQIMFTILWVFNELYTSYVRWGGSNWCAHAVVFMSCPTMSVIKMTSISKGFTSIKL